MLNDPRCPVCDAWSRVTRRIANWGEMRECVSCGLVFSKPMALPGSSAVDFFNRAYQGRLSGEMRHFHLRLEMAGYIEKVGNAFPAGQWQETFVQVLQEKLGRGARILDIGCGTGLFMKRLQKLGFQPLGLDVAEAAVRVLRGEGYQVWHGGVATYPQEWPEPDACTLNLVLHHAPDPVGFLNDIRERFPKSGLLVSDIRASKPMYLFWKPPRHLTIWTARSLRAVLGKAGYHTEQVYEFPVEIGSLGDSIGHQVFLSLPPVLRRMNLLRLYYLAKPVLTVLPWAVLRALDMNGNVCAVAEPL